MLVGDGDCSATRIKGGKALRDIAASSSRSRRTETLRIAHPHDLLATGEWDRGSTNASRPSGCSRSSRSFASSTWSRSRKKATARCRADMPASRCDPAQANGVWGQRGWNVQDGVWKTFHDVGITAVVGFNSMESPRRSKSRA